MTPVQTQNKKRIKKNKMVKECRQLIARSAVKFKMPQYILMGRPHRSERKILYIKTGIVMRLKENHPECKDSLIALQFGYNYRFIRECERRYKDLIIYDDFRKIVDSVKKMHIFVK